MRFFHFCLITAGKCQKQCSWPFVSCHQLCQSQLPSYIRQLWCQDYQTYVKYQLAECKYVSRISSFIPISQKVASVFQRKRSIVKCSEGKPKAVLTHQNWTRTQSAVVFLNSHLVICHSGGRWQITDFHLVWVYCLATLSWGKMILWTVFGRKKILKFKFCSFQILIIHSRPYVMFSNCVYAVVFHLSIYKAKMYGSVVRSMALQSRVSRVSRTSRLLLIWQETKYYKINIFEW